MSWRCSVLGGCWPYAARVSLGPTEVIVVLVVALLVLGPDKLPHAARTLGKYLGEFRKFSSAVQSQVDEALKMADATPTPDPESEIQEAEPVEPKPENPDTSGFELIDEKRPSPPPPPPGPTFEAAVPTPQPTLSAQETAPKLDRHGNPPPPRREPRPTGLPTNEPSRPNPQDPGEQA